MGANMRGTASEIGHETSSVFGLVVPDAVVCPKCRYFALKRMLDVGLVLLVLVPLLPIIALIAIVIKLDSSGPAFFKQERVGAKREAGCDSHCWKQHLFTMYKFRTMQVNADPCVHYEFVKAYIAGDNARLSEIQAAHKVRSKYKLVNDPRLTRVGRILRKSSMDELPQIWNVLRGDMSLVGPRPPIPYEVEMYQPWHHKRLKANQGITGLWQVSGRSSTTFEGMVKLDIKYIEEQSLWFDIKIILWTLPKVLSRKGAR